ncbi:MAG: flagellar basal-body rod protein FlgF [Gammaproteobacteria bacterium]|nr:flagellar basal-body rod protein FlgF [Gammaproteobacteria bacterium]
MNQALYTVMSAADKTMAAQAVSSHNLANASTNGFRADLLNAESLALSGTDPLSRPGIKGRTVDFTPGALVNTGRDLDVAIQGDGWIAVQARDGSEAYTRAGDLHVNTSGVLENANGYMVMGNGGPITLPPAEKLEIGVDGTISIRPLGQTAATLAVVDRLKLVNPDVGTLVKGPDGLLRTRDGKDAAPDAKVRVSSGSLESSNVNAVEEMVRMISLARQFEMQIKMMATAQQDDTATAQIMRLT